MSSVPSKTTKKSSGNSYESAAMNSASAQSINVSVSHAVEVGDTTNTSVISTAAALDNLTDVITKDMTNLLMQITLMLPTLQTELSSSTYAQLEQRLSGVQNISEKMQELFKHFTVILMFLYARETETLSNSFDPQVATWGMFNHRSRGVPITTPNLFSGEPGITNPSSVIRTGTFEEFNKANVRGLPETKEEHRKRGRRRRGSV